MHLLPAVRILMLITLSGFLVVPGLDKYLIAASSSTTQSQDVQSTKPDSEKPKSAPDLSSIFQMHYENRVKSFRDQNLVFQNVVLLGDSITEGFDVATYFAGRRVVNRGIGADVIGNDLDPADKRGVLKRLDESVFDVSPTDVFILIGINDLGQGHSPETIEAGYREMLTKIRKRLPELKLHVQSILPSRGAFAKHNPNILDVNNRLRKLAAEFKCDYIDLHSKMTDAQGELKAEFTKDGLHLTAPAYEIWRQVILDKMGWK